jgi:diguanylate cyclase
VAPVSYFSYFGGGRLMKKHPWTTYAFIWFCNLLAITIFLLDFEHFNFTTEEWVHFFVWTSIVVIARLGGLFAFTGSKLSYGWATAVEFAAVLILPFPLLCLAILISCLVIMTKRVIDKHPEPFVGPDFNASNIIISGFISMNFFNFIMEGSFAEYSFAPTLALILATVSFALFQMATITTVFALDEKMNWFKAPTLTTDSLISETVFIFTGALLGKVYISDPFIIIFMLFPLLYLHKVLSRLKDAKLVYVDEKTGLYNYRYFDEKLTELFVKAEERFEPFTIIFIDMDHLREVNNTYGHNVGDEAIAAVGNTIQKEAGDDAICARFGGEEFVVILKNQGLLEGEEVAEKIRRSVNENKLIINDDEEVSLSISLGVATYPDTKMNLEDLVEAADKALYHAKNSGRNLVMVYTEDMGEIQATKLG